MKEILIKVRIPENIKDLETAYGMINGMLLLAAATDADFGKNVQDLFASLAEGLADLLPEDHDNKITNMLLDGLNDLHGVNLQGFMSDLSEAGGVIAEKYEKEARKNRGEA